MGTRAVGLGNPFRGALPGASPVAVSFAADIRPLFRNSPDIDMMREYGLDLSSYEDVKTHADEICGRLEDGSMPCDGPWPEEDVELFRQWIEEGLVP